MVEGLFEPGIQLDTNFAEPVLASISEDRGIVIVI